VETNLLFPALKAIAAFFDGCKVGYQGTKGYRKSTDLFKFIHCIRELRTLGFLDKDSTVFTDLGCADGRVNIFMSYFVRQSIGIEIDSEILNEYTLRRKGLDGLLRQAGLPLPPGNIFLFNGNSIDPETYKRMGEETGVGFADVDIFYTYITLHDVFGEKIAAEARPGALYLVYGFNRILPRYGEKMEIVLPDVGSQGIAALYRKKE